MKHSQAILSLLQEAGALKNLRRSGWVLRGIREAESIADHSYRMVLLCLLLADELRASGERIDSFRVLRMAVLHEIGEARLGDIPFTAGRWLGESVKETAEGRAVRDLLAPLAELRGDYEALWEEFSAGSTREARLVLAADKLEMIIQAFEYERSGARTLDEFFSSSANRPFFEEFPVIREMMELVEAERSRR
jgi:putative hydrolase of HD superfamily